jgi:hypothetical protein
MPQARKSSLTGLFFDSTFGGRFPATMARMREFQAIQFRIARTGAADDDMPRKCHGAAASVRNCRFIAFTLVR